MRALSCTGKELVIEMLGLNKVFLKADEFTVEDISLEVKEKEYFVLMGPTGSGKTLLIKAICGLIGIESGQIIIDGVDVTDFEPRARWIGYVPQESGLFGHLNVERNLTFPLEVAGLSRQKARVEIEKIIESLKIGHLLGRSIFNLSGGEQQKIALGRALARKPKLLVLDEPVSSLDQVSRNEICEVLREVQKDFALTTIHICHNPQEARAVSDRVGIISGGRLIGVDTLDGLISMASNEEIKRLLCL